MEARDLLTAALCLALAGCALRWLLGRRPVAVIRDQDYRDGRGRTFVRVEVRSDGSSAGTYLADADSGRPLQFTGCRAVQVQSRFRAADRRTRVAVLLDGVPLIPTPRGADDAA